MGPSGAVYAFEPSARIRVRLERNVELNEMRQINVRSEAVTCKSGVVRFVETPDVANDGLGYVQTSEQNTGVEVRSVSLDEVSEFSERTPTLIKVDVEGGEPEVYRGARALLERADAPSIIFESFHIDRDAAILREHGYHVLQPALRNGSVRLTRDLQAPPYRRWEAPNFLAVKSARGQEFVAARVVD